MGKKKRRAPVTKSSGLPIDDIGSDTDMMGRFSDEDPEEKILLDEVFKPNRRGIPEQEETSIYGIEESSDEEEDEDGAEEEEEEDEEDLKDELADSDIDGMEDDNLPNLKAWGKNKRLYYNTDYVDNDQGAFVEEEDEMAAELEEQEAMNIQKRLVAEIDATDDVFAFLAPKAKEADKDAKLGTEVISKDLREMSKKEKLQLLEKESPEFLGLVNDFKSLMQDVKLHLLPVVKLIEKGQIPPCTAGDSVKLRLDLILNYCTNICFYLLLKLSRKPLHQHPVIHRLVAAKQLILSLEPIYQDQLLPQIELILQTDNLQALIDPVALRSCERVEEKEVVMKDKRKKDKKKTTMKYEEEEDMEDMELEQGEDGTSKRGITYQIAKNKGLTPNRKKELKNPRVKNKIKFRKAKIRRKGQVREPRKELDRYGGELSGIKASVRKSIPLK